MAASEGHDQVFSCHPSFLDIINTYFVIFLRDTIVKYNAAHGKYRPFHDGAELPIIFR